jgi:ATP-dependent helicase/nuclease subunit B
VVDGLCEEFSASAFEPRFFELSIGRGEDSPAPVSLRAESGRVNIYGIVDRVDAYKKGEDVYLRVIDYKTGHKDFSPDDMAEGANLQMFVYLKALLESENEAFRARLGVGESGRIMPAGVIYVKTSVGDVRVDTPDDEAAEQAVKEAQRREGMLLDDEEIISAMNLKYTPLYSAKTPDKIPDAKRKYLYSEEGWEQIMQTVEGSVARVADGIRAGEMPATPKWQKDGKSSCEYCEFKPICRKIEK